MSALVEVVAVLGILGFVIGRQLIGQPLRGKNVLLLPAVLTVIGMVDLNGSRTPARPTDIGCMLVGALVVAMIGVTQGMALRLESRDGYLWGQMPPKGLWLWLVLILSRLLMTVVADGLDAKLAAASSTILLMLGINRLAQAAVVVPRAMTAGISFAPEKNGRQFLPALTNPGGTRGPTTTTTRTQIAAPPGPWPAEAKNPDPGPEQSPSVNWTAHARQASTFVKSRRDERHRRHGDRREDHHRRHDRNRDDR